MKTETLKAETLGTAALRDARNRAAHAENLLRAVARDIIMFETELAGSFAALADEVRRGRGALDTALAKHAGTL